ncbi:phage baseplate assembly protein V [Enterobacter bugandensis]|uniref:phage baseplate assembly protein V n=1 Tax=Enterobacter bugandensis TaxID=881260 RepID=UPI002FD6B346
MSTELLTVKFGLSGGTLDIFYLHDVFINFAINSIPYSIVKLKSKINAAGNITDKEGAEFELMKPGNELVIMRDNRVLFSGVIVERSFIIEKELKQLTIKASHKLQSLCTLFRSQLFTRQTDAAIIKAILNDHKITSAAIENLNVKHEQMVQYNCFDWHFLISRLNASSVWLMPTAQKITIKKPSLKGSVKKVELSNNVDIFHASLRQSNKYLSQNIEASSWNIARQEMSKSSKAVSLFPGEEAMSVKKLNPLNAKPSQISHSLELQQGEQVAWSDSRLLALEMTAIQGEVEVEGDLSYDLGQGLSLENFGKPMDGKALITGITQHFTPYQWRTRLTLGTEWIPDIHAGMVPAVDGLHIGIVAENSQGPDDNHCFKVHLPALSASKTVLARLASPFASKDSGINFYPEKGDEVMIGFLEDDPRFPIILGAVHNPKNKAPKSELAQGPGIVIKNKGKTQSLLIHPNKGIILEEKKGGDTASLILGGGELQAGLSKSAQVTAKGTINIESSGALNANGRTVKIKGTKVDINQ